MTHDLGALEILIAVDVIAMMMREHHMADGPVGHLPDGGNQRAGVHGGRQRVDDQDALIADDKTGVSDAGVVPAGPTGLNECIGAGRHLFDLGLPRWRQRITGILRHTHGLDAAKLGMKIDGSARPEGSEDSHP